MKKKPGMSVQSMTITPALAKEWLEKRARQRSISPTVVAKYVAEMLAGRWVKTGEPIQRSKSGHLLNGQHRLSAIVESGMSFEMVVVNGLPDEALLHIDTGKRRSMGDLLRINLGVENANAVASTLTQYFIIGARGDSKPRVSTEDYIAMYQRHKDDVHWAITAIGSKIEAGGYQETSGCGPVWGAFAYMRSRNSQLIEQLAHRFRTMEGLTPRDNAATLRKAVHDNANRGSQEIRRDLLASALQCIDAELNGKKISTKQLDSGRTVFAKIDTKKGRLYLVGSKKSAKAGASRAPVKRAAEKSATA